MIAQYRVYYILMFILFFCIGPSCVFAQESNVPAEKLNVETKDRNEDSLPDVWIYFDDNKQRRVYKNKNECGYNQ